MACIADKVTAIEVRDEFHAARQQSVVEFSDLFVEGFEGSVRFRAFAKEDYAFDHVVVVDDGAIFAANSFSELTEADLGRLHDFAKIADADWGPINDFDEGGFEIGSGGHQTHGANVESLLAALNEASASVRVVVGEGLLHLAERQAVRD